MYKLIGLTTVAMVLSSFSCSTSNPYSLWSHNHRFRHMVKFMYNSNFRVLFISSVTCLLFISGSFHLVYADAGCGPGYDNSTCGTTSTTTLPQGCGYGYDNSTCGTTSTTTLPQGCGYGYDNSTCGTTSTTTLPQGCGYGYNNSTCGSIPIETPQQYSDRGICQGLRHTFVCP
jgi:hypothetical protein